MKVTPLKAIVAITILITVCASIFILYQFLFIKHLEDKISNIQKPSEISNEKIIVKPPPPNASPNGHWHEYKWHDEPHDTDVSDSNIPQQSKPTLLTTEQINQLATSSDNVQQALKDHDTITQFYHDEANYYRKYETLLTDNEKINSEFDKVYIPEDKINALSDTEKIKYKDRLRLILRKLDLNKSRRDLLEKEKPKRPDDAFSRYQKYIKLVSGE